MVMLGVIAGSKHVSMQLSRTFSGLSDLLFNRRCVCVICYISILCTQTQGVHIDLIILENRFMLLIEYIHLEFMFALSGCIFVFFYISKTDLWVELCSFYKYILCNIKDALLKS